LDLFCVSNPSELFTVHYPEMLKFGKTFAAHIDHPPQNVARSFIHVILNKCNLGGSSFNSGLMLIKPSDAEYHRLVSKMNDNHYPTLWGDQGFLNAEYDDSYYKLPFEYNANVVCKECEPELWNAKQHEIVFYHFTVAKPWRMHECSYNNLVQECMRWQNFQPNSATDYSNWTAETIFIDTID